MIGYQYLYTIFYATTGMWLAYHGSEIVKTAYKTKSLRAAFSLETNSYLTKTENDTFVLNRARFKIPFLRGFLNLTLILLKVVTFIFTAKSGLNAGIITSIFSTCIVFTTVLFYFIHNQVLTRKDFIGITFLVGCVVLISLSPNKNTDADDLHTSSAYRVIAIVFAVLVGMALTTYTVEMHYSIKTGLPLMQANIDGGFILGLIAVPFYLLQDGEVYNSQIYILSNLKFVLVVLASYFLNKALSCGKAGRVQSLDYMKTVWKILLTVAIDQQVPSKIEMLGCVCGLIGTLIIVLSKEK